MWKGFTMRTVLVATSIPLGLLLTACGAPAKAEMPNVVGERLDVALSDIDRAGYGDDPEILGGGLFGVVQKSNWTVCKQDPATGDLIREKPRLTVDRECEDAAAEPSPEQSTEAPANGRVHAFGETVKTTVDFSDGTSVPLDVTVSAPTTFTPSHRADAKQAVNIYFTVTIKNDSNTEPFRADVVVTDAISGLSSEDPALDEAAGDGKSGGLIIDSKKGIVGVDGAPRIRPGHSITFKDGFSVASVEGLTYKIQPAGMASETLYFQQ